MFRWYVVNTYSGHENKVKSNLEHRASSLGQRRAIRSVVVPTETVSELTPSTRIGVSAGLLLLYEGGVGSVRGKRFDATLMAACTSCSAASMLRSRLNCSVICELPKLLTDVICVSAGTCPNCRSRGVVTDDAMVLALAPGRNVETTIVG